MPSTLAPRLSRDMLRTVPSKYYEPGTRRADKVQQLFAAIAPHYDRVNDLQSFGLHRLWKRRLVRLAALRPQDRALDVCCGTGDVAFLLARAGARVTGIDASPAMLAVAHQRAAKRRAGVHPIAFHRADALQLPFPDHAFDVVTIAYGLRNLADLDAGLAEIARVLRPAGRLLILECGVPQHPAWRLLYFAYLRLFVPLFGRLFCRDADTYRYILDSLQGYPAQQGVLDRLQQLGFTDARVLHLLGGAMSIHVGHRSTDRHPTPAP